MLRNASASTGSNMKWISIKQLNEMLVIQKQLSSVANMLTILKNAATDVNEDK